MEALAFSPFRRAGWSRPCAALSPFACRSRKRCRARYLSLCLRHLHLHRRKNRRGQRFASPGGERPFRIGHSPRVMWRPLVHDPAAASQNALAFPGRVRESLCCRSFFSTSPLPHRPAATDSLWLAYCNGHAMRVEVLCHKAFAGMRGFGRFFRRRAIAPMIRIRDAHRGRNRA